MTGDGIPEWAETLANSLLKALRERDPYTYGHCYRVARNSKLLAKSAGLSEKEQKIIEFSSLFHDLGKIGIPDRILLKPGKLTKEEETIMKTHPTKSAEIIEPLTMIPFFKSLIPGILYHHERIDGKGYPHGITGNRIPLMARVILIADTFDAITTNRPYRKSRGNEFAYKELKQFSGRQFDEKLVEIFVKAHPQWGDLEEEITESFVATHFKRAA